MKKIILPVLFTIAFIGQIFSQTATINKTDVSCNGASDGIIEILNPTGGVPPYEFSIIGNAGPWNTSTFYSNLPPGTYDVWMRDFNATEVNIGSFIVINEPLLLQAFVDPLQPSCFGGMGTIEIQSPQGGSGFYEYSLDGTNWQINQTFNNIMTNTPHQVYMRDQNVPSCSNIIASNVIISDPPPITATVAQTDATCFGANNGSIEITGETGGMPPYEYSIDGGVSWSINSILNSLNTGTYNVMIRDMYNCQASLGTYQINEGAPIESSGEIVTQTCSNQPTGSINLSNVTGGTLPYSFSWSNFMTGSFVEYLNSGNYFVTITDFNGCSLIKNFTIDPMAPFTVNLTKTDVTCNGKNNGTASVVGIGGIPAYTYYWGPGQFDQTIDSLSPGNYEVWVTDQDGYGCTFSQTFSISEPSPIQYNTDVTHIHCVGNNDGTANIYPWGGIIPYSYLWSNTATTQNVNNLAPGKHYFTITDANSCQVSDSVEIFNAPDFSVSLNSHSPTCFNANNGWVETFVNGGTYPLNFQWSNGNNGSTNLYNLPAGSYTLTITDYYGCITSNSTVLTDPAEILFSIYSTPSNCSQNDGMAWVTVTGGNQNYSYSWSNASNNDTIPFLSSGLYYVTVYDTTGCEKSQSVSVNDFGGPVVSIANKQDVSCYNGNNGQVSVNVSGGVSPYSYYWIPWGYTNDTITNLNAGTYTVTVTDASGCNGVMQVEIVQPQPIDANLITKSITCNNLNDGRMILKNIIGGVPPYSILWSTSSTQDSIINLASASYFVTITDYNNCFTVLTDSIINPVPIQITFDNDSTCFNSSTGIARAQVSGGVPPYSFNWNVGSNLNSELWSVAAGNYSVTVTDLHNCSVTGITDIYAFPALDTNLIANSPTCFGGSNGSIVLNVTGGVAPYTYQWSNNGPFIYTQNLYNITAGGYNVTVTDAANCNIYGYVNLTQPNEISLSPISNGTSSCSIADGQASVFVYDGIPPFSYNWGAYGTNDTIFSLAGGSYPVTVTDATGCFKHISVIVNEPAPFYINYFTYSPKCFNGNDGAIKISPQIGSPYVYNWSVTASNDSAFNLSEGEYFVTVTDTSNCSITQQIFLGQPSKIHFYSLYFNNPNCAGGSDGDIYVNATGGTGFLTYSWSHDILEHNSSVSSLAPGTYTITATDENLCISDTTVILVDPAPLVIDSVGKSNPVCEYINNGEIRIFAHGGTGSLYYTIDDQNYYWSNIFNNLNPGTYNVRVKDANNCFSNMQTENLFAPPPIVFDSVIVKEISCNNMNDGEIHIYVHGGQPPYQYTINNGVSFQPNNLFTNVGSGNYMVSVTDFNNCYQSDNNNIYLYNPYPIMLNVTTGPASASNASDGVAQIYVMDGTPPYSYLWDDLNTNSIRYDLTPGSHFITVTDAHNCSQSTEVIISFNDPCMNFYADANLVNTTDSINPNGSIHINASGTYPLHFKWADDTLLNSQDRYNLNIGTYIVTVSDFNGCSTILTTQILYQEPDPCIYMYVGGDFHGTTDSVTNDGWINVLVNNAIPPFTFQWSDTTLNSPNRTGLAIGTYYVTVVDSLSCFRAASFDIGIFDPCTNFDISLSKGPVTDTISPNGFLHVNIMGGVPPYTFLWNDGNNLQFRNGLNVGTYTVTVTDSMNCVRAKTEFVDIDLCASLFVNITHGNTTDTTSNNGWIDLVPQGGQGPYHFTWADNTQLDLSHRDNLFHGNYQVTVSDTLGCTRVFTINVGVGNYPCILTYYINSTSIACFNDTATLQVIVTGGTPPYSYTWSNGYTGFNNSNLTAGTYIVTVSDASCFQIDTVVLTNPAPISVNLGSDISVCEGTNVSLDAGAFTLYQWNSGQTTQQISVTASGIYSVVVTDFNGCNATDTVLVSIISASYSTLTESACNSFDLNGTTYTTTGTYTQVIPNVAGCDSTITLYLTINLSSSTNISENICDGDTYTLPDNTVVSTSGTYPVTITSIFGCDSTIITNLTINPVYHDTIHASVCQGENYTLPDNSVVTTPGIYPFNNLTINGCDSNLVVDLVVHSLPIVNFSGLNPSYCVKDTFVLLIGNHSTNGTFAGSGIVGGNVFNPKNALIGTNSITYTYTDSNGCTNNSTQSVTINEKPTLTSTTSDANCGQNNGSATLSGTGGTAPYTYSTGSNNLSNLSAGVISVTITDNNGCASKGIITISNIGSPVVSVLSQTDATCSVSCDGSATLDVTQGAEPYTFLWSNGETAQDPVALCSGENTVVITDALGCVKSAVLTLGFSLPDPTIYGRVTYSGGGIDGQYAKLDIFSTSQHQGGGFDLMNADVQIGSDGSFIMANFPPDIYILKVSLLGNNPAYANLMNSYYTDTLTSFSWETSDSIMLGCGNYLEANIVMHEMLNIGTGNGSFSGSISYPSAGGSKNIKGIYITEGKLAGEPVPGAEVYVELEPDDEPIANTVTDVDGLFAFENLPEGNFSLTVEIPGFPMLSTYTISITETDSVFNELNFFVDTTSNNGNIDTALVYASNIEFPLFTASVYPNPYQDYLNIRYALSKTSFVNIQIFDSKGYKLETIQYESQNEGEYTYTFNPNKYSLNAGTYIIQLQVDKSVYLKKVILVK